MKMMKHWIMMLGLAGLVSNAAAVDPRLSYLSPGGLKVGTETEVTFRGQRLADAEDVFFYHPWSKSSRRMIVLLRRSSRPMPVARWASTRHAFARAAA